MTAPTARQILTEALATIEATYWVKKAEYIWKSERTRSQKEPIKVSKIGRGLSRSYLSSATDLKDDGIVGVCSIGAMSLAITVLGDSTLQSFTALAENNFEAKKAGHALASVVRPRDASLWRYDWAKVEPEQVIASWNDKSETKKHDVVSAFTRALADPILDAKQLWYLAFELTWSKSFAHLVGTVFHDQVEAIRFKNAVEESRQKSDSRMGGTACERAFARYARENARDRPLVLRSIDAKGVESGTF